MEIFIAERFEYENGPWVTTARELFSSFEKAAEYLDTKEPFEQGSFANGEVWIQYPDEDTCLRVVQKQVH